MSLTAAGIAYILKKTGYDENIKNGWINIQQYRAERDFLEAVKIESPSALDNLREENSRYLGSNISRVLEPGYQERIEELFEEYEQESL